MKTWCIAAVFALAAAGVSTPSVHAQEPALPDGPGKEVVVRVCSGCHDMGTTVSARGTEKDWQEVVELMVERGAQVTPEEAKAVVTYLAAHFGPKLLASHAAPAR